MRIRRETVAEQCVQLLRRQILEWRLVPGEVVTEESIARDMGVSRPTVREVLNTLIVEGLLTRNPTTRSLCVTRLDCGGINEIYRVRRLLEAAGVRAFGALDDVALQPLAAATATLAAGRRDRRHPRDRAG
ncbi:DNA-binding GntR family transcriptional regulator [Amaricoccus macauensis]|uniref:DNA-binding GntR family transcriptional regulator n=1 Tax=Amaricoccus macauensis TaxID=57001 RepID=A0A840SVY7_9RHOB|nr:GntR family transcriptional regulator [Amaricoccus macauensis]MBB5223976.1 DNA-binding GntR family transcriptional regulator [Amaricoccus macauensis]